MQEELRSKRVCGWESGIVSHAHLSGWRCDADRRVLFSVLGGRS